MLWKAASEEISKEATITNTGTAHTAPIINFPRDFTFLPPPMNNDFMAVTTFETVLKIVETTTFLISASSLFSSYQPTSDINQTAERKYITRNKSILTDSFELNIYTPLQTTASIAHDL